MDSSERAPARDAYAGLQERDYFHIMLNLDSHPGFPPTARALADRFLRRARDLQSDPKLEPQLRPFSYSPQAYEMRLDQIHRGLVEDVERYEAQRSWTLRTRADVVEWIRQMAPLNQTDGSWLRNIASIGPMDDVTGLLFTIWAEELGGGNPQLNHANIYTELLESVGIFLPDVRSREYADNPDLLDSAFTLPLFQLVVSQFPQAYLPELLGMTQYLGCSAVELKSMVRLAEYFGLDPHFYEIHVAADNAATGHRALARQAVQRYLEHVRITVGDQAVQAHWERIWTGYVAFATTGTLAEDMRRTRLHPSTPADRVAAIVAERAPRARLNHGRKRLGGKLINDLFADPNELMNALLGAGMVVPGDAEASPFFELLAPDGPMYKIFTHAEITTWKEWVRSLPGQPSDQVDQPDTTRTDPALRMSSLVDAMRLRQESQPAHASEQLTGPDPDNPEQMITQPVAWWFRQPTPAVMQALANKDNGWVVPGDPDASPWLTDLLQGDNAMAHAFSSAAPGGDGMTWLDVAAEWIKQDCPIPTAEPDGVRPLSLLTPPERVAAHPTGKIRGAGSVH